MNPFKVEYVWLEGLIKPCIKSKTKIIMLSDRQETLSVKDIPPLPFGGHIESQSIYGKNSEFILVPVFITHDPQRSNAIIALSEVFNTDGLPSPLNNRRLLVESAKKFADQQVSIDLVQDFYLIDKANENRLSVEDLIEKNRSSCEFEYKNSDRFFSIGYPYICDRDFTEDHMNLCLSSGITYDSLNANKSPGQWSYQIGNGSSLDIVKTADELIISRFLLQRLSEKNKLIATFDGSPLGCGYNKSYMQIIFSTKEMRSPGGIITIQKIADKISNFKNTESLLSSYGYDSPRKEDVFLTGFSEKCETKEDILPGVKIPFPVIIAGGGYLKDSRPLGFTDPYKSIDLLLKLALE